MKNLEDIILSMKDPSYEATYDDPELDKLVFIERTRWYEYLDSDSDTNLKQVWESAMDAVISYKG